MSKNILVVEDDKQVREGVRDILEANEYTVFEAYNEKTALHHLSTVPIQTIILDIQLGEENGFDLCRKIRAKSNVPILFLTALTGEMELVRGFSIGGDDCFCSTHCLFHIGYTASEFDSDQKWYRQSICICWFVLVKYLEAYIGSFTTCICCKKSTNKPKYL